ncbi:hypothetical protein VP1G_02989 [Cytospora mali]|uniref:Uncharacterized protein n=1 Tax=Cytospora mali TaxID=578113 RepID=A0A194UVM9_CYTMA|nr:hypothetical protein VP1G_02989 [Valsa mali var. pyri (nom. inval.)]
MFSQQWGAPSKKRGRDDEDVDVAIGGTEGFTEHRNKRLQALPFRTSPSSARLSFPPSFNHEAPPHVFNAPQPPHTITPGDSDSEDANKLQHNSGFPAWTTASPTLAVSRVADDSAFSHAPEMVDDYRIHDVDMDMDMDDSTHLGPGPSQPDLVQPGNITSRMPTPIHCSFAAQVRGGNWSGAAGNVMQSGFGQPPVDRSVPRTMDQTAMSAMADWSMVQNRRLPSPISESGCDDLGRPGMALSSQSHPGMPPRAASAMDLSTPARSSSALSTISDITGESGSNYSGHTPITDSSSGNAMDIESPATPSPKKGHARSRHTLNSWTQMPGMKKTFSIGYRADCEKCQQKVPGHFNHIIVS